MTEIQLALAVLQIVGAALTLGLILSGRLLTRAHHDEVVSAERRATVREREIGDAVMGSNVKLADAMDRLSETVLREQAR